MWRTALCCETMCACCSTQPSHHRDGQGGHVVGDDAHDQREHLGGEGRLYAVRLNSVCLVRVEYDRSEKCPSIFYGSA